jgi:hypothetical protein
LAQGQKVLVCRSSIKLARYPVIEAHDRMLSAHKEQASSAAACANDCFFVIASSHPSSLN